MLRVGLASLVLATTACSSEGVAPIGADAAEADGESQDVGSVERDATAPSDGHPDAAVDAPSSRGDAGTAVLDAARDAAGDAIVELLVDPHPFFTRKGHDVHVEVPVTVPEAVLGATIKVPTLDGTVALKVPKGSNSGTVLRLKSKGIPDPKSQTSGNLLVTLKVMLPDPPDPPRHKQSAW